jgi:hypothetical protein
MHQRELWDLVNCDMGCPGFNVCTILPNTFESLLSKISPPPLLPGLSTDGHEMRLGAPRHFGDPQPNAMPHPPRQELKRNRMRNDLSLNNNDIRSIAGTTSQVDVGGEMSYALRKGRVEDI